MTEIKLFWQTLWWHEQINWFQHIKKQFISSILDSFPSPANLSCNLACDLGLLFPCLHQRTNKQNFPNLSVYLPGLSCVLYLKTSPWSFNYSCLKESSLLHKYFDAKRKNFGTERKKKQKQNWCLQVRTTKTEHWSFYFSWQHETCYPKLKTDVTFNQLRSLPAATSNKTYPPYQQWCTKRVHK